MTHEVFNSLISLLVFSYSFHMIYYTYKEPSSFYSTNLKGYIGGGLMITMSLMSLAGKFSLLDTFIQIVRKMMRFKQDESGIGIVLFLGIIYLIVGIVYYRPDKIQSEYQNISPTDKASKIKLLSGCFFFYYAFTLIIAYLAVWLYRN